MAEAAHGRVHDSVVVGGGVNGCGSTRDVTGRGTFVPLAEEGDPAGATPSASAHLWWRNIGDAAAGTETPQDAMNALGAARGGVPERLERADVRDDTLKSRPATPPARG